MERIVNRFPTLLALLAGALLPLGFAPVRLYPLAVLAPAMLYLTWHNANPRQAFWRGWCFGLGFFTVGTYWIYTSIHIYGLAPMWLAGLLTAIFIMGMALYPAINGWLLKLLFPNHYLLRIFLAFPATWVLFEWLRAWFLTGFPWLLIGFSQVNTPLSSLAPIIGVYGLSFLIIFSSGLLVLLFEYSKRVKRNWRNLLTTLLILIATWTIPPFIPNHWTQIAKTPLIVSLIQGDIAQSVKWDKDTVPTTIQTYLQLTKPFWASDIIVWPEGALPVTPNMIPELLQQLNTTAKYSQASLITGITLQDANNNYYNGITTAGFATGTYRKRNLVPFGEFVPLEQYLRGLIHFFDLPMSNLQAGPANQSPLNANGIQIAPLICYEIAYSNTIRSMLPKANVLLTISDDTWFGDSFAPAQHLQIAQMRSLQTGRYQMVATNDGITALINSNGKITDRSPQFTATVLRGRIYSATGTTPWIQYGDLPVIILCFLLVFATKTILLIGETRLL